MRVKPDIYVTDSADLARKAIDLSGGPGIYVPVLPFKTYAEYPRDLEVYLQNIDGRTRIHRILLGREVPETTYIRLTTLFGNGRVQWADVETSQLAERTRCEDDHGGAVAFEEDDDYGAALAANYANARGLTVLSIPLPDDEERSTIQRLLDAMDEDPVRDPSAYLDAIPRRQLPLGTERLTVIAREWFPYQLLYRNTPVGIVPAFAAPRIFLEEIALTSLGRRHVNAVAIDGTTADPGGLLQSEIPWAVGRLVPSRMMFSVFGRNTSADLLSTILNHYPFDLLFIAAHSVGLEVSRVNYLVEGKTGSHRLETTIHVATGASFINLLSVDGEAIANVSPTVRSEMLSAFGEGRATQLDRTTVGTIDEGLLLPNGDSHLGQCRMGPGSTLPVVFGNFCGSRVFGQRVLAGGAGAFVGTMWQVNDRSARDVAKEFVVRGQTARLSEALHDATREAHTPGDRIAYIYLGTAEYQLDLIEEQAAYLLEVAHRFWEVARAHFAYAPLEQLPEEFKASIDLVIPRFLKALDLLVEEDPSQRPTALLLRSRLPLAAIEKGTPAGLFREELENLLRELRGWRGERQGQIIAMEALVNVGAAIYFAGEGERGLQLIRDGIQGAAAADGDPQILAGFRIAEGNCEFALGHFAEADSAFSIAQAILIDAGLPGAAAVVAGRRISSAIHGGRVGDFEHELEEMESLARKVGDSDGVHATLQARAALARLKGNRAAALSLSEMVLTHLEERSGGRALIPALYNLGVELSLSGRHAEAEERVSAAVCLAREFGDDKELLKALNNRAALRFSAHDPSGCRADLAELQSTEWCDLEEVTQLRPRWNALDALIETDELVAARKLSEAIGDPLLPTGMRSDALIRLTMLHLTTDSLPGRDELLEVVERAISDSLRSGDVAELVAVIDPYIEMQMSLGNWDSPLLVEVASALTAVADHQGLAGC